MAPLNKEGKKPEIIIESYVKNLTFKINFVRNDKFCIRENKNCRNPNVWYGIKKNLI